MDTTTTTTTDGTAGFRPFDEEYLADPYPVLARLRREQPVSWSAELEMWVVTRWADVDHVFRHPETFSAAIAQDPILPLEPQARAVLAEGFHPVKVMSNLDPPEHARIRRHNMTGFSPRRLRSLEPQIRAMAVELVDQVATSLAAGPVDLVARLCFPLPAFTIFRLLGFPDDDAEMLKGWCGNRMAFSWGLPTPDEQVEIATQMKAYWGYCERFVDHRSRNPADDFTSDLLAIHHADPATLSVREITSIVYGLSFAGHETTTNLLANTIRQLLTHRHHWDELVADASLVPAAVEEGLRYDSSVIAWRRITTRATELGGVSLPQGARLLLMLASANRDPDRFADPDRFDPHRPDAGHHLSFGKGIHYCLGAVLARLQVRIVLEELTARVPALTLTEQAWRFHPNVSFRGPRHLLVQGRRRP
jgi:cytochrome P450